MKLEKLSPSVELFTIELKEAAGGGIIALTWGENLITTQFKIAK
jgi:hypothetical protein